MSKEYDITYATKEYLMSRGWKIIAYNPPGAQGTFTIPNPDKESSYRGQTGSESPDIVAYKEENNENLILVVEAKPEYDEADVKKLVRMFSSETRKKLFLEILYKQAVANEININRTLHVKLIFGKAHGGDVHSIKGFLTFNVKCKNDTWNSDDFDARIDPYKNFEVREILN